MGNLLNLIPEQLKKNLVLAVIVLLVGIPLNYVAFSSWQKKEAVASLSQNVRDNNQLLVNANDASNQLTMLGELDDGHSHDNENTSVSTREVKETAIDHAKKHADPTYICPMHPEIVSKDPEATCPICGMDLVIMESNGEADVVELTPTVINALGVRTEKVKRRNIYRQINSVGYITVDEKNIRRVTLRTEGWIENLVVKSEGERVKQGDLLFQVYSPKLVNAQEEYVQALELDNGDGVLISASKSRLDALGISDSQIEKLRDTKQVEQLINVYSPQDGVITDLTIREGDHVSMHANKGVVSIVDLSSVWLLADIFESQVDWIEEGQDADARLAFMPDKNWKGVVEFVYPSLDPKTRSVKARLRFENADELLKPNMYANVTIYAKPKRKVLAIPREAVIRQGNQSRVIIAQGGGKFKPAIVHTGIETEDKIEIVGGLEEGQEVVTSSQFLIDSESSMRAALMRMTGG